MIKDKKEKRDFLLKGSVVGKLLGLLQGDYPHRASLVDGRLVSAGTNLSFLAVLLFMKNSW